LVTGAAGFIGFHVSRQLLARGEDVIGLDNMNDYYDVELKRARLAELEKCGGFTFVKRDIADSSSLNAVFSDFVPSVVVNLAAQAGVRYSLENPNAYIHSNITGFTNILECCRHNRIQHLVYASSSSVYGANATMPFSVHHGVDHPMSLYAATKKSNELMAHTYSHLFGIPSTGLRFFTVYGPWGRPDMALFLFTKAILEDAPIDVFNYGRMSRNFTYIDDVVDAVVRVLDRPPKEDPGWRADEADPATSRAPYRVYNVGSSEPVELMTFIRLIESSLGRKAQLNLCPMQPGDVPATFADIQDLMNDTGYVPRTPVRVGIEQFINWYRDYYKVAPYFPARRAA
jgi:UDP-glucuronate 4-epimerase